MVVADLEVLSKLVGDPCFTDLAESLVVTIDWYRRLPSDRDRPRR